MAPAPYDTSAAALCSDHELRQFWIGNGHRFSLLHDHHKASRRKAAANCATMDAGGRPRYGRVMLIYKIFHDSEWQSLRNDGQSTGAPIDRTDGFVHLSTGEQCAETAAKYFAGQANLMLLAFESDALGAALKWEPSRGGALFPHLYRALQLDEMLWAKSLPLVDGQHAFPDEMLPGDDAPV
ncbi:MAG: hypothetical protein ACI8UD_002462 [Planctomycetota bacterium]